MSEIRMSVESTHMPAIKGKIDELLAFLNSDSRVIIEELPNSRRSLLRIPIACPKQTNQVVKFIQLRRIVDKVIVCP